MAMVGTSYIFTDILREFYSVDWRTAAGVHISDMAMVGISYIFTDILREFYSVD